MYNGYIYIYRYLDIFVIDIYGDKIFMIDTHTYIYTIYIHIFYVTDRNKEGKAGGKRSNQMVAKWPNRSVFGWNTLYLASKVLGA